MQNVVACFMAGLYIFTYTNAILSRIFIILHNESGYLLSETVL